MPSTPPPGEPAPPDGSLPASVRGRGRRSRRFGVYVHVPFCADPLRLLRLQHLHRAPSSAAAPTRPPTPTRRPPSSTWRAKVLGAAGRCPAAATVFFGGGTPTLLPAGDLAALLGGVRDGFGLAPGRRGHHRGEPGQRRPRRRSSQLAAAGFTRVSFGMQSAVPHVLADAGPHPRPGAGAAGRRVGAGRRASSASASTSSTARRGSPPTTGAASLDAALGARARPRLAPTRWSSRRAPGSPSQVRRGEMPAPDDDELADDYELADEVLGGGRLRLVRGQQLGPRRRADALPAQPRLLARRRLVGRRAGGAPPRRRLAVVERAAPARRTPRGWRRGLSPAQAREVLTDGRAARVEQVLLGVRLAEGLPLADLAPAGRAPRRGPRRGRAGRPAAALAGRRLALTRSGRLLADGVVRRLLA